MPQNNKEVTDWLKEDSKYLKIAVGESYRSIYLKMQFDPTGGYKGKATIRYLLKDLEDGKVRELSSSSKALANAMMKMVEGDEIVITALLSDKEQKTYEVQRVAKAKHVTAEKEKELDIPVIGEDSPTAVATPSEVLDEDDEKPKVDPAKIPF